jgi:hypothetical protein
VEPKTHVACTRTFPRRSSMWPETKALRPSSLSTFVRTTIHWAKCQQEKNGQWNQSPT